MICQNPGFCSFRRLGLVLAVITTCLVPQIARTAAPSPGDWRDEVIYQVITDRFYDGDSTNNNLEGVYNAASGTGVHGGDWAGLKQKLDYMQTLGVTSVWISPVVLNKSGAYHGYGAKDFNSFSPQFGGITQLRSFVDAAHARGMHVIIDMVCNHTADFITGSGTGWPAFHNPGDYTLSFSNGANTQVAPFNNLAWYHNNGAIGNFVDPDQILGELSSLDDLRTEDTAVRNALYSAYANLIDATDCDGFRVDTVKHVDHGFWQDWCPRIHAHCASIGKNKFFMYGEVFDGSDAKNGSYTGTKNGGAFELDSVLYYPMFFQTNSVFVSGNNTGNLSNTYGQLGNYDVTTSGQLVSFLDNHDQPRFLSQSMANGDTTKLYPALTFQLLSIGVPTIYYGTEQAFEGNRAGSQSNDPYDREDMFDGAFEYGTSLGDNFNEAHALFLRIQQLNDLRRNFALFRRGTQKERWTTPGSSGIYAFERSFAGDSALVVVNNANAVKGPTTMNTFFPVGTVLVDALTSTTNGTVNAGSTYTVTIPARGSLVLMPASKIRPPDPAVAQVTPTHDATGVSGISEIQIKFNEPMDAPSVSAAFTLTPAVAVTTRSIDSKTIGFTPKSPLAANTLYQVRVTTGAKEHDILVGGSRRTLRAVFESRFKTGNTLSVPPGYAISVFADNTKGLVAPEGLAWSPGGAWGNYLYVGDEGTHGFFRIPPDATTVSVFSVTRTFTKPEGIEFDATSGLYGGRLMVGDAAGVYAVASNGTATAINAALAAANTGAAAVDRSGLFRNHFYLGSNQTDNIIELNPDGTNSSFQTGLLGFEALTFGPGNAFGTDMYAADPNLSTVLASINGTGAVFRVQPNGTRTTFALNTTLAKGIACVAIDPYGSFNGDMFGADVLSESIIRITSAGVMSTFATGFGNLFGSHCITFDPTGAMYVADTGSWQAFTDSSGGTAVPRIYKITSTAAVSVSEFLTY